MIFQYSNLAPKSKPVFNQKVDKLRVKLEQALDEQRRGNLDRAKELYREILKKDPNNFDATHLLGVIHYQKKDFETAVKLIKKSLEFRPDEKSALNNLGNALSDLKKYDESIRCFTKAISRDENYVDAYSNRALSYFQLENYRESFLDAERALKINPNHPSAIFTKAMLKKQWGMYDDAQSLFLKYLEYKPNHPDALNNLCLIFRETGNIDKALDYANKTITLYPKFPEAFSNRGLIKKEFRDYHGALKDLQTAVSLKPDLWEGLWNQAAIYLMLGHFEKGWELYEYRRYVKAYKYHFPNLPDPVWTGKESIKNKKIFVYSEQGLGDCIHFCRYVKKVAELGAEVYVGASKGLENLFKQLEGAHVIIDEKSMVPLMDFQVSMLSLPNVFKTTEETIPWDGPYLFADKTESLKWKEKLSSYKRKRIGIVWASGYREEFPELLIAYLRKTMPFEMLEGLQGLDADLFSLQKGNPSEENFKKIQQEGNDKLGIVNLADDIKSFSDTAAIIENLDVVISVCTSTAHLAAAMGKPTYILIEYDACWRWLLDKETTNWYPSAKLIRQVSPGNWESVMQQLRPKLENFINNNLF